MASILDENQQKSLIELMLSDPSIFSRVKPILKSEYFDKKFQVAVYYLNNFTNQYSTLPTIEQLNNESRNTFSKIDGIEGNLGVRQSILDGVEGFCKKRALEIAAAGGHNILMIGPLDTSKFFCYNLKWK